MKHLLIAAGLLMTPLMAQGPDVAVSKVASNSDYAYYGQSNGIAAYSFATTSCNVGDQVIEWTPSNGRAPAIATTMYKITPDGVMTMMGYSWLKDSFCAVSEPSCGSCQGTPCSTLGIGCADTYGSGLNDGASGVAKFDLNPVTGQWPNNWTNPSGALPLRGRLQIPVADAADSNNTYIAESLYICNHDQENGLGRNNASWQEFVFSGGSLSNLNNVGAIRMFDPAIFAWQEFHPDVHIDELVIQDEGGPNVNGYLFVASKATDIGLGFWRYDYAVMNMNSDLGVGSFALPTLTCDVQSTSFYDVDHHSGSPWKNTDWAVSTAGNTPVWTTDTFAQDPNANAIHWNMMYNFSIEVGAAPAANFGTAAIGLFKNGASMPADVIVPGDVCGGCTGGSITQYCSANANSASASGSDFSITGSPNVTANDLAFLVTQLPSNEFGIFLMSPNQDFVLNGLSNGNLCLGAGIVRWNEAQYIVNSGPFGIVQLVPDLNNGPFGYQFQAGETWNFQFWHRDGSAGSMSANSTAGVEVTFCQ